MKKLIICGIVVSLWLQVYSGQAQPSTLFDKLKGSWECNTGQGIIGLVFSSATTLSLDGETATYQLLSDALRVATEWGPVDYPYSFMEGNLLISFPEGFQLLFNRKVQGNAPSPAADRPGAQDAGSGRQLFGRFCNWSGSSSSYSGTSSSSTRWAYFDGNGSFSWGSESSFSSNDGIAYGSRGGDANRGTYSVQGKVVYLSFPDGSQGQAKVNMVQDDGRITELMFEGSLYAKGLCE